MKAIALAAMALPMIAAPALAGPYVESKTTSGISVTSDKSTYKGSQTELRVGYDEKVGKSGLKVYGEIGPGYEFNTGKTKSEGVAVGEVGFSYPLAKKVSLKGKVAGEYGMSSEVLDLGGEVKVRYSF
jgi:hypothetical protein